MGNIAGIERIDNTIEAMHLLIQIGCQEKYGDTFKKYEKKDQKLSEEFRIKSDILTQIEADMEKCLKDKADDMKFYFGRKYEEGLNVAQMALLWNGYFTKNHNNFESWLKELSNMSEEDFCKKFSEHLIEYSSIVLEDLNEEELQKEPISVVKQIMEMNISDEEKWKLQNVFMYPEKHRENVLSLLQLAKGVMKKHENDICKMVEMFDQYWKEKLEKTDILEYLRKEFGINLDENPYGTTVMPSIFLPTTLNLFAESNGKKIESEYLIRVGVLFDDTFQVSRKVATQAYEEEAVKNLKLLSDKSKFEILSYIKEKRAYGSELAKQLNLTTATISHHMSALLNAGLVRIEKEETKIFYRANTEEIEKLLKYCENTLL